MTGLLELADRCEKAAGPDRELACTIAKAIGFDGGPLGSKTSSPWAWCPDYTASIDAAMTLVPEGWSITLFIASKHHTTRCMLAGNGETVEASEQIVSVGRTPPTALCAAALRARATLASLS